MNLNVIKIKLGIYFIQTKGLVRVPLGIYRSVHRGGWGISLKRYPDVTKAFFKDSEYNGTYPALMAAIKELAAEHKAKYRKLELVERPNKRTLMDHVGISYSCVLKRKSVVHQFVVSLGDRKTTVYIGTDETWMNRYHDALEKAHDVRYGFEHERTVENYWKGIHDDVDHIKVPVTVQ